MFGSIHSSMSSQSGDWFGGSDMRQFNMLERVDRIRSNQTRSGTAPKLRLTSYKTAPDRQDAVSIGPKRGLAFEPHGDVL